MMSLIEDIRDTLVVGNAPKIKELCEKAVGEGKSALDILNDGLVKGMEIVSEKWKCGEYYIPNVLIAARAMKEAMSLLEPVLVAAGITPVAKAVIGTVEGDLHDIGKNLVAMMWKGANFDVVDLGTNVSPQKFVDAVRANNAQLVGLSALLTTTMPAIKSTVDAIKAAGLNVTKIVIGGAPVTQEYADEVGADGYAADAASAVNVARALL